jgi:hypothetical protein
MQDRVLGATESEALSRDVDWLCCCSAWDKVTGGFENQRKRRGQSGQNGIKPEKRSRYASPDAVCGELGLLVQK